MKGQELIDFKEATGFDWDQWSIDENCQNCQNQIIDSVEREEPCMDVTLSRRCFLAISAAACLAALAISASNLNIKAMPRTETQKIWMPSGFGVGDPHQNRLADSTWIARTHDIVDMPWWYDWRWDMLGEPNYVPMIWGMTDDGWSRAGMAAIKAHQSFAFIGNEPAVEGVAPRDAAEFIKKYRDETEGLPFGFPGIFYQDGGKRWINEYLAAGGPSPDVWTIHIYTNSQSDWWSQTNDAESWLRGEVVMITEAGSLEQDMLPQTLIAAKADNRWAAVAWFSMFYGLDSWRESSLVTNDGTDLTKLGRIYRGDDDEQNQRMYMPMISS